LCIGGGNVATTEENNLVILQKMKLLNDPDGHSSTICNSQDLEATQMSIQMDEWQSPNEILFSHNTEEILTYLTA
jgi:hypothetical protein